MTNKKDRFPLNEGGKNKIKNPKSQRFTLKYPAGSRLSGTPQLKTNYLLNNTVSIVVYLLTFLILYYAKKQTFLLENQYFKLFWFLLISLIVGDILSNKFILTRQHELWQTFRKLSISLILCLGFLSILLILYNISDISRILLLKTVLSGLIIESYYFFMISERRRKIKLAKRIKPSLKHFLIDGLILSICLYYFVIVEIRIENLNEEIFIMLAIIYFSWILAAATTHKFQIIEIANYKWEAFSLQIKFYLLIIPIVLLSIFLLNIKSPYWDYIVEAIAKYSITSCVLAFFIYGDKIRNRIDEATSLFLQAYEIKYPLAPYESKQDSSKYK